MNIWKNLTPQKRKELLAQPRKFYSGEGEDDGSRDKLAAHLQEVRLTNPGVDPWSR